VLAGVMVLGSSSAAVAQQGSGLNRVAPPQPRGEKANAPIASYGFVVIVAAVALGAAAMPSKRGHQD